MLDLTQPELDIIGPTFLVETCSLEHGGGHVNADDPALGAHLAGRQEAIDPAAGAQVEHGLTRHELCQADRITTSERETGHVCRKLVYIRGIIELNQLALRVAAA